MIYYATFGLGHPFKNYVQPILVSNSRFNEDEARKIMSMVYNNKYAALYELEKYRELNEKFGPYQELPTINANDY